MERPPKRTRTEESLTPDSLPLLHCAQCKCHISGYGQFCGGYYCLGDFTSPSEESGIVPETPPPRLKKRDTPVEAGGRAKERERKEKTEEGNV